MAESKYESKICSVPTDAHTIYSVLSNLQSLEKVRDLIPQDKVQEMDILPDVIKIKVDGLGQKIAIRIVEKQLDDTIKFGMDNLPITGNFWIQLKQITPIDTRIRLTIKADIPMMFKMMLDKKIQDGLDRAAEMLTQFPYSQWLNA